jgi:signal transduction histidine kinase
MSGVMIRAVPKWRSARVLGLPAGDVGLAAFFALAAVTWVLAARHSGTDLATAIRQLGTRQPAAPLSSLPDPSFLGPPKPEPPVETPDPLLPLLPLLAINILPAVALTLRRRWPYLAFGLGFGALFVIHAGIAWPGFLALLVLAYSLVAYGRRLVPSLIGLLLAAGWAGHEYSDSVPPMPGWLTPFALLAPLGLFGAVIGTTRARADAAARRALAIERERDASTRAALAEERARIARELHDVVSHHVSVMVIQAGAAGAVLPARPDLAADALRSIGASGREAMAELRHLLGLVAPLDDALHPQPGLADLDALVAKVRAAGQPVTISQTASPQTHGVDLTAYRVVQEGLTNALRYAPGAPTYVEVRQDGTGLVVEVRNDQVRTAGPHPTGQSGAELGSGTGLVGLAERLRLFHGTLDCGRRLGGGFGIRAWIPMSADGMPGA